MSIYFIAHLHLFSVGNFQCGFYIQSTLLSQDASITSAFFPMQQKQLKKKKGEGGNRPTIKDSSSVIREPVKIKNALQIDFCISVVDGYITSDKQTYCLYINLSSVALQAAAPAIKNTFRGELVSGASDTLLKTLGNFSCTRSSPIPLELITRIRKLRVSTTSRLLLLTACHLLRRLKKK